MQLNRGTTIDKILTVVRESAEEVQKTEQRNIGFKFMPPEKVAKSIAYFISRIVDHEPYDLKERTFTLKESIKELKRAENRLGAINFRPVLPKTANPESITIDVVVKYKDNTFLGEDDVFLNLSMMEKKLERTVLFSLENLTNDSKMFLPAMAAFITIRYAITPLDTYTPLPASFSMNILLKTLEKLQSSYTSQVGSSKVMASLRSFIQRIYRYFKDNNLDELRYLFLTSPLRSDHFVDQYREEHLKNKVSRYKSIGKSTNL